MKSAKTSRPARVWATAACMCSLLVFPAVAGARTDAPLLMHPKTQPAAAAVDPPTVREVRTVVMEDGANSLTLVIAIAALAIALSGTAYLALRVRPMLRT
jgi:hypothetical protein